MLTKTLLTAALTLSIYSFPQAQELCSGIVPDNDMNIPVSAIKGTEAGAVTEDEFNGAIDLVEEYYSQIIKDLGGNLIVHRRWTDGTVNASAMRQGPDYVLNMYGGLARHTRTTPDSFLLVVCHELGHHIGGAPKYGGWFSSWASNEGQSDYFGALKCMRRVLQNQKNSEIVSKMDINPEVQKNCATQFTDTNKQAICIRTAMAGEALAFLFKDLRKDTTDPSFSTPDENVVERTKPRHPDTQCRLDTYYQGALCDRDFLSDVSQSDPKQGTCFRNTTSNNTIGTRPLCWYKPGQI